MQSSSVLEGFCYLPCLLFDELTVEMPISQTGISAEAHPQTKTSTLGAAAGTQGFPHSESVV